MASEKVVEIRLTNRGKSKKDLPFIFESNEKNRAVDITTDRISINAALMKNAALNGCVNTVHVFIHSKDMKEKVYRIRELKKILSQYKKDPVFFAMNQNGIWKEVDL